MDVLRQAFSVLLVFSLLGAVLWMLRRGGRVSFSGLRNRFARKRSGENARSMESLERLLLTPQHTLHLVRVNGCEVLVATHPQGCTLLTAVDERAKGAGA